MTDQDWEVDGAAGGAAGADGARPGGGARLTDETPARAAARATGEARTAVTSESANVVPFPGNWFGSVDELVPVHPEPWPSVAEVARAPVQPPAASAADAMDFWEGDAAALEEVSTATDPQSSIALLRSPGAAHRNDRRAGATVTIDPDSADGVDARSSGSRVPAKRSLWTRVVAVLMVTSAAGAVLLVTHALTGGLGSRAARNETGGGAPGRGGAATGQHQPRIVTQTVTTPVTVTTTLRTRRHRHRASSPRVHRRTEATSRKAPVTTVAGTSVSGSGTSVPALSAGQATTPSHDSSTGPSHRATPSSHRSAGSAPTGSSCAAQSPDSGCLP